jgi:ABC-2 type transport system permease protein
MRNTWTIAKREFAHYFVSPIAYAVAVLFLSILGLLFVANVNNVAQQGGSPSISFVFGPLTTLLLFFAPVLTMRLLADEQNKGTLELLLTAPLQEWELVVGKWLGAWLFGLCLLATTTIFAVILYAYGNPDTGVVYAGLLGLALLIGAILAIGVFASSITGNLIASVAIGYAFVLTIWIIGFVGQVVRVLFGGNQAITTVAEYIDFAGHFSNNFNRGVIDTTDIVYFVSVIVVALFMATRVVEARRWR